MITLDYKIEPTRPLGLVTVRYVTSITKRPIETAFDSMDEAIQFARLMIQYNLAESATIL